MCAFLIRLMYRYLDTVGTGPQFRAAAKLLLLTMVRKSELAEAEWSEVNFTDALWVIPKARQTRLAARNVHRTTGRSSQGQVKGVRPH